MYNMKYVFPKRLKSFGNLVRKIATQKFRENFYPFTTPQKKYEEMLYRKQRRRRLQLSCLQPTYKHILYLPVPFQDSRPSPSNRNMFHVHRWGACSSDFVWVAEPMYTRRVNMEEIWRNFSKSQGLGGSLEFFQYPEPWRKLEIFLSPRNMKK